MWTSFYIWVTGTYDKSRWGLEALHRCTSSWCYAIRGLLCAVTRPVCGPFMPLLCPAYFLDPGLFVLRHPPSFTRRAHLIEALCALFHWPWQVLINKCASPRMLFLPFAAWLRRCASFACSSEPVRVRVCEYVLVSPLLFDAFFCPVQCTPSSIVQVTRLARPGSPWGPGRPGLRVGAGCFVTYRQAGKLALIPWRMS